MLLAVLVVLPSLGLGFFSDDYAFVSALEGTARWVPARWDLYNFIPGVPHTTRMIDVGGLPWWSSDHVRLHLVRPSTSLLLLLDHTVFGRWALGYHLHGALWWLALVGVVNRFFRANFPARVAFVASVLFVVCGAHGMVYAWLACRHLLIAGTFGVAAISLFQRGLRDRRVAATVGSAASLALALTASEAALGVVPFLLFAALADRDEAGARRAWPEQMKPLLAPLVVTTSYFVAYKLLGGGSVGGGTYVDPISAPLRFLGLAIVRLPMLVATALLGIPVEAGTATGPAPFVALGLLATLFVGGLTWTVWPSLAADTRRTLGWLAPSALLAIGVGLGGIPGSRQLVLPNLFFAPLLACLVLHGLPRENADARGGRFFRRGAAGFLTLVHLPFAVFLGLAGVAGMKEMKAVVHRVATSPVLDAPSRFFVLGTSDPLIGMYTPPVHVVEKGSYVRCWSMLAMTKANTLVERVADATIVFEIEGGHMLTNDFETLTWDPREPMPVGFERRQCGATIRVLATHEGLPRRVQVTFDASLEGSEVTLLRWKDQALVPLRLAVGEKTRLPWTPGPMGFL